MSFTKSIIPHADVNWDSPDSSDSSDSSSSDSETEPIKPTKTILKSKLTSKSTESEDSDDNDNSKPQFDTTVYIFGQQKGRFTNTYIVGLNGLTKDNPVILKYLQVLKSRHGCNGTIKQVLHESENKTAIQLQGDLIKKVRTYLKKEIKIDQKIKIKPLN